MAKKNMALFMNKRKKYIKKIPSISPPWHVMVLVSTRPSARSKALDVILRGAASRPNSACSKFKRECWQLALSLSFTIIIRIVLSFSLIICRTAALISWYSSFDFFGYSRVFYYFYFFSSRSREPFCLSLWFVKSTDPVLYLHVRRICVEIFICICFLFYVKR